MPAPIESRVAPSAGPSPRSPAAVTQEFHRALDDGARIVAAGAARRSPRRLLRLGYVPRYKVEVFDATYFLCHPRQNDDIRFFVGYVELGARSGRARRFFSRIFYKDVSLTWRSASHYVRSNSDNWIGKGDVVVVIVDDDFERVESDEATTDLPLEIQGAFEALLRRAQRIRRDETAVPLVLRRGSDGRVEAYRDFTGPRRRAQADRRNLVNAGRKIARFTRRNDPTSLRFTPGFEPDFTRGVLEIGRSTSRLYGGRLRRYRIASRNGKVQYLFIAGPRQAWIASCQATTTDLSSYGVRTIDVPIDEEVLLPAYEYHFYDDIVDPPELVTQIPPGFAGERSPLDDTRVDASPWIDRMPVMREFRRKVLGRATR